MILRKTGFSMEGFPTSHVDGESFELSTKAFVVMGVLVDE